VICLKGVIKFVPGFLSEYPLNICPEYLFLDETEDWEMKEEEEKEKD
jgi:hypothetical protein